MIYKDAQFYNEKREAKPEEPAEKKLKKHPQVKKIGVYKPSWKRNLEEES